jgi:predicted small lipoprotein YifL
MKFFDLRASRLAPLALVFLLTLTACGKKGPVQPLLGSLPDAPQRLRVQQQGESFLISWNLPANNQDGTDVEDIGGFRIYRNEYAVEGGCPTCRDPKQLVAKIDLKFPVAQQIKRRLFWRDLHVAEGSGYRYRIVPVTVGGRKGKAATTHQDWMTPPRPPEQFQAHIDKGQVRLNWQPPAQLPERAVLVGYNLYRRPIDRPFSVVPVNPKPLKTEELIDRSLEKGRTYEYQVSSLVLTDKTLLESAPTDIVQVTLPASE